MMRSAPSSLVPTFLLIPLSLAPWAASADAPWPDPAARGWVEATALAHLHSPYSHDACDGEGLTAAGLPDPQCLARLRQAMCDTGRDAFFLTDHPAHMTEQVFEDLFLYDPALGDRLIPGPDGQVLANEILCLDGDRSWSAYIFVGWENDNAMPVGLGRHVPAGVPSVGYNTGGDLAAQQASIEAVHAAGGLALIAHAEEDDITPQRILDMGLDALELYNAHANINVLLYRHPLELLDLEDWVVGAADAPISDYVALMAFRYLDLRPLDKWDAVTAQRPLPGWVGTDVHENVTVDPLCGEAPWSALCRALDGRLPNLVAWLTEGGPIPMADGERLDSYDRMFRWFSNHLLVREPTPQALEGAMAAGRGYVAFDILALPQGFDALLEDDGGRVVAELGASVAYSPDLSLMVSVPRPAPVDVRGVSWPQALLDEAVVTGRILRATSEGVEEVGRIRAGQAVARVAIPGPGAYRVELDIVPRHLAGAMGSQARFAYERYSWLWSNPLYVVDAGH